MGYLKHLGEFLCLKTSTEGTSRDIWGYIAG